MGHGIARPSLHHCIRFIKTVVETDESLAVGVETVNGDIDRIEGIMVAALLVLCLVVDCRPVDLNLSRREITLEILHVGCGIPQTPLQEREKLEAFGPVGMICECKLCDFSMGVERHKEESAGLESVFLTFYYSIVHAVATFVGIKRGLGRFPTGIPDSVTILYVEITATGIHRHTVVAVTGEATEFGILIEAVASGGIGD